uniref:Transmembrane protein n=1 Tax=Cajanus cajan TaxID=3821 RepID=A0A151QQL7_CAJCA|nr:hypothetical protein KK1_046680 [Cajanus cajan]
MAHKIMILITFLMFLILNLGSMEASRKNINVHPPPAIPRSPQPPSLWYTPNDDFGASGHDAFRPTSPGHSPGAGHEGPPTKA